MRALRVAAKYFDRAQIIVLSGADLDSNAFRDINEHDLITAGATGFISKSSGQSDLIAALSMVVSGNEYFPSSIRNSTQHPKDLQNDSVLNKVLTPRQLEIIAMVSMGYQNKTIADKLNITEGTIKGRLSSAYQKIGVKNRTQVIKSIKQTYL